MTADDTIDNKNFLDFTRAHDVIAKFLRSELSEFVILSSQNYGMGYTFTLASVNYNLRLNSDRGDLSFFFSKNNETIDLLTFEPKLSKIEWFSEKNIHYVLSSIKQYINSPATDNVDYFVTDL